FFIILVIRALTLDGAMEGVKFFLSPDFSQIESEAVLYALGQSFFSLAVGFSCMVTYSSYLDKRVNLTTSAGSIVSMNIFVSLLAGLAIFPVVFAFGLAPEEGPPFYLWSCQQHLVKCPLVQFSCRSFYYYFY